MPVVVGAESAPVWGRSGVRNNSHAVRPPSVVRITAASARTRRAGRVGAAGRRVRSSHNRLPADNAVVGPGGCPGSSAKCAADRGAPGVAGHCPRAGNGSVSYSSSRPRPKSASASSNGRDSGSGHESSGLGTEFIRLPNPSPRAAIRHVTVMAVLHPWTPAHCRKLSTRRGRRAGHHSPSSATKKNRRSKEPRIRRR